MAVLTVQNLIHSYSTGTPFEKRALNGVDFEFSSGEIVALIGHTGSGKSTLLKHLNGLLKPDSGDVLLDGKSIFENKKTLYDCRFKIGLCFQYPEQQLFESTLYRDIAFGPSNMKLSADEIDRRVKKAMDFVGLPYEYLENSPFDLSGGEKRRAAIAGVLAMEPSVLILDEPTAGLDPAGKKSLLKLILNYNAETGATVIFVSHNMDDVAAVSNRVLVMQNGGVALSGDVASVFSQAEKLTEMGLDVPEITRVILELKKQGVDVDGGIFTVEDAKAALLSYLGKGACK